MDRLRQMMSAGPKTEDARAKSRGAWSKTLRRRFKAGDQVLVSQEGQPDVFGKIARTRSGDSYVVKVEGGGRRYADGQELSERA